MKTIFALLLVLGLTGCASNKHKAEKLEKNIEKTSEVSGDTKLGVNKDGNMVVQKKVMMSEELRRIQNEVYSLEDRVYGNRKYKSDGLYGALKKCRAKLSSKQYGGDGKLSWTEPAERITDKEENLEMGLDDKDQLIGVSEEFLKDRIDRFRGYKSLLGKREDEYKDKLEICDAELESRMSDNKTNN